MKRPYLLLTPGPLTTTDTVKQAMLTDYCTWDDEYKVITEKIRQDLLAVAGVDGDEYTVVPLQGSGSYSVEAVLGTVLPHENAKLLIGINGAYGRRMSQMADVLQIPHFDLDFGEEQQVNVAQVKEVINAHPEFTHFAIVHCETTTGILNDIEDLIPWVKAQGLVTIVDAMSSFGGVPMNVGDIQIDFMISSANKCIQGVPGFAFVIARRAILERCQGQARSLSLDLYDQNKVMDETHGKWRFTSPTHVVHAFSQALDELKAEGGVTKRYERYQNNQALIAAGLAKLGYQPLLAVQIQSPIITSFLYPQVDFDFQQFYEQLKLAGFVIYPGKVSEKQTFRIGNIGEVYEKDAEQLIDAVAEISNVDVHA